MILYGVRIDPLECVCECLKKDSQPCHGHHKNNPFTVGAVFCLKTPVHLPKRRRATRLLALVRSPRRQKVKRMTACCSQHLCHGHRRQLLEVSSDRASQSFLSAPVSASSDS